ncbi:MAG TPA: 23S rRNA (adenine(2503)-C(2))-methyltransferase RlmN [bacterium]|nr:23S rRNA (adenine(2503)-C(2))-methyltransferase RlmN [bacterium]
MFSIHEDKALLDLLASIGEKPYRLKQIHQEFYKNLVLDFSEMTSLPAKLRESLASSVQTTDLTIDVTHRSEDGQTTKILLKTHDDRRIEAVIMRHLSGRTTLCISCQAGCPMACSFCATGTLGLERNLSVGEILDQITIAKTLLAKEQRELRNIVFMGMGEPLTNYDNVCEAIRILSDQKKWDFSSRRITVSTCGIAPKIVAFGREFPQVSLAISLHAPNDTARSDVMPVNKTYPLEVLMAALDEYVAITNKRVFYEYIMIAGVTDRLPYADELATLLAGRMAHVNFIPYNA